MGAGIQSPVRHAVKLRAPPGPLSSRLSNERWKCAPLCIVRQNGMRTSTPMHGAHTDSGHCVVCIGMPLASLLQ